MKPVKNVVTCAFGVRGRWWFAGYHTGRDYRARTPVPVRSTARGVVVFAGTTGGWGSAYGKHVIVDSGGVRHLYAHLSRIRVKRGQKVAEGARLGLSGQTGNAPAPHVHYEERVAPYGYMNHRRPRFDS